MAWLLAHMWISLAAAGLFGLLFGWAIRGILVVGKLRTARVDRDVAKTELEQARAEIEGLYAAQRNVATGASDPHLKAELNVREKRMTELSAELTRSKAELEALKAGAGRGGAVSAPAVARPAAAGQAEEPTLLWRNRHLEGRVRHLEAALHEQASATQGASPAAVSIAAAALAPVAAAVSDTDSTEIDKLKWQGDFLKQRVAALEAELATQPAAAVIVEAKPEIDVNEELARLRWRNRFLEGRVAYFEGDAASEAERVEDEVSIEPEDESDALISATDSILHELEEADAAADADERDAAAEEDAYEDDEDEESHSDELESDDDVEEDDESDEEDELDDEDAAEEDDEDDEDDEYDDESDDDELSDDDSLEDDIDEEGVEVEASDDEDSEEDEAEDDESGADDDELADEGLIEAERPIALEKPVAGAPDDLTIIGGIGPKIQEVLNELGIFHYDQIAAWTPENIAWIDDQLNFSGRIAREGWVEQAAILSGDVAEE
jgi:predicted flap endonuclease-1-like 5' DNA nuclease